MAADLKLVLVKTQLCKYLDMHELDILLRYSTVVDFADDTFILHQGKISHGTYIIVSGKVAVTANVVGAGVIHLGAVESGGFLGEVGLLENGANDVSAVTRMKTECIFVPNAYFSMLAVFSPATKFKLNQAAAESTASRLKGKYETITAFMVKSQMTSSSIFGDVMHSFARPKEVLLQDVGVMEAQLLRLDFFRGLSAADVSLLLKHAVLYDAARHCPLIKSGEKNSAFYLILRGAVQSRIKKSHKIAKLSVLPPLSVFCGVSFIDESAPIIDFTACERTLYFKISALQLAELKKYKVDLWYYLYDAICKSFARLEQAANKLDVRLHSELYNR